jgi:hypothetical protein
MTKLLNGKNNPMLPSDVPLCSARCRTRGGEPCRNAAMPNGRCRMHGGKSPAGIASPSWKSGRFSRYMPKGLRWARRRMRRPGPGGLVSFRGPKAAAWRGALCGVRDHWRFSGIPAALLETDEKNRGAAKERPRQLVRYTGMSRRISACREAPMRESQRRLGAV